MLTIIRTVNFIIIAIICLNILTTYLKYRHYKKLYGKHYKNIFNKEINKKYKYILSTEKSKKYKKIKKKLFDAGWDISVNNFIFLKIALFLIGSILLINVNITNKTSIVSNIIQDVNYRKVLSDVRVEGNTEYKAIEIKIYNELKQKLDITGLLSDNIDIYLNQIKTYVNANSYNIFEGSDIISRRMLQKLIDIKEVEDNIDDYLISIFLGVLLYFIPDVLCAIRKYLIEDKKHWEIVISIFTYCIFAQIPPYKTSIIVDNIIEVTDIYKTTFEKINYNLKNGKGEEIINEIIKTNSVEEELLELLETIKLTITTGVEKTVENMEALAQNTIEWQKIKQHNRRNKKYFILIPILIIIFMLCFDYVMYGLTEIVTSFRLDI